ncbi:lipopolysaccharide transport periplasmic protein LptA [Thiocystis violacea]|uniref:lipopolysaccharide transport periplasmic protein LptA n=1 Tax=Thiocystis violacea TaxID=13725 RepID=UPI001903470E|nr:lipopolysaccharide transport periplasmic protein LptA [Thiocystis violacea]MBK1716071.1 lipopolysaccharide transport periplasmic protein LptA [Thiocystis violacea]
MTSKTHPTPAAHRHHRARLATLLLAGGLAAGAWTSAWALKEDASQPIYIEADDVEVRESDSTSVYVGNVQVDQGSMRLLADHVTVYHREDRQPRLIIALGQPARYKQQLDDNQGEVQAFGKRVEYDADKDELTLIGDGLLIQGEDRLSGERIVYERAKAQFRAGGAGRVKITIVPDKP